MSMLWRSDGDDARAGKERLELQDMRSGLLTSTKASVFQNERTGS